MVHCMVTAADAAVHGDTAGVQRTAHHCTGEHAVASGGSGCWRLPLSRFAVVRVPARTRPFARRIRIHLQCLDEAQCHVTSMVDVT